MVAPAPRRSSRKVLAEGVVIDHYELIRSLGSGGMGQVFLARDLKLGRHVALKVLHPTQAADAANILVEARATAKCRHENIVVIHDMNQYEGMPYLVLEYLEGSSLRQLFKDGALPLARGLELFCGVLRGLENAHAAGIIHRDLKPDNVFVTSAGVPKILDFGIAKLHGVPTAANAMGTLPEGVGVDENETYVTISGNGPVGTWSYMSPEQFRGEDIDHRTDLWALGIIMFKFVAGRHPYGKLDPSALMFSVGDYDTPVPSVARAAQGVDPNIAPALFAIIDRCLRKRREERFPHARAILDVLEPLVHGGARPTAPDRCPYPGLQAFEEADAERFFGRTADVTRAVARLDAQPLLAVVGPSGAGKSSFIRAGVVPALKRGGPWETIVIRPGRQPLTSIGTIIAQLTGRVEPDYPRAVARQLVAEPGFLGSVLRWRAQVAQARVLLLVDQLEELYTQVPDPAQRLAFVTALRAAADDPSSPVRVVLSLRSDFLDRAAEDREFMDAVTAGLHYLMPLGTDGLRDALVRPLQAAGHAFESPALVEKMLGEIATTSGALPLLQFAAAQMWEARDRPARVLTEQSYVQMGGIAGTLAAHADRILASLPWQHRQLVHSIFRRLVTAEGTRAIVDLDELVAIAPADVRPLVDTLVAARLLVSNADHQQQGATVEIVHESLITAWPQLRLWMEAGRDEAAFLGQLRQAAQQWDARGRAAGLLWRGEMADETRRFGVRLGSTLGARERAFVDAVLADANRSARRKRIAVMAVIIGLVGLVLAGGVVVVKVRAAEQRAVSEATAADTARGELADQLRVVQEKEAARVAAEKVAAAEAAKAAAEAQKATAAGADAEMSHAELKKANEKLHEALSAAQAAVVNEQAARAQLQKLFDAEKARNAALENQKKKIATELR